MPVDTIRRSMADATARIGTHIGAYRLTGLLGSGGSASVYTAEDERMGRQVALKLLHLSIQQRLDCRERFDREARIAARLNHPNVVTLLDFGLHDEELFLVFEYMEGGDCQSILTQQGRLKRDRALHILRDTLLGLRHIHAAGLLHRDIKPHNIFLSQDGIAKIGDLGLAREQQPDHGITEVGAIVGSPAYMSPEQVRGEHVDIRSDIYSIGICLYAFLSGQSPFRGESTFSIFDRIVRQGIDSAEPLADEACWGFIRKASALDPKQRYKDADTCLTAIDALLEGSALRPVTLRDRKNTLLPMIVGSAVLLLAAIVVILLLNDRDHPSTPAPAPTPPSSNTATESAATPQLVLVDERDSSAFPKPAADTIPRTFQRSDNTGPFIDCEIAGQRLRCRLILAGSGVMGSPKGEIGHTKNESRHEIVLSANYYLADSEIPLAWWQNLGLPAPSDHGGQAQHPVYNVSHAEAQTFCETMQRTFSLQSCRLPSEAEWEYACRAGTTDPWHFGDTLDALERHANIADSSSDFPWAAAHLDDGAATHAPIRSYAPNPWGLYDMYGNVWEWCADAYRADLGTASERDPFQAIGHLHVVRGGSWEDPPRSSRSASRKGVDPDMQSASIGFRVIIEP